MSYLEGLTKNEREEVTRLIDAEIQWYMEQFKRYEEDLYKPMAESRKAKNPLRYEDLLDIVISEDRGKIPLWKQIVYDAVVPHSPLMKCLNGIEMCSDPDPKVMLDNFEMYAQ